MNEKTVIELLKKCKQGFLEIEVFSKLPGIYAIFFIGENFPLFNHIQKNQIIYIGKTESSQEKRDSKTHFKTGKTGSSTVRKSIGSILYEANNLNPIPRNSIDYEKGRFSHFTFDDFSEKLITDWMKSNLGLSFFEYPKEKEKIKDLEIKIINEIVPILNISNNLNNKFRNELLELRRNCATAARNQNNIPKTEILKQTFDKLISDEIIATNNLPHLDSNCIIINNITKNDTNRKSIRITVPNKILFLKEEKGVTLSANLTFIYDNIEYKSVYKIGSKDGKSRSGILKVDILLYSDILKIKCGDILKICEIGGNKFTIGKIK